MPEKVPAPSVLKARRRRRPIFIDEPIQWHLRNGKFDRCPWCGLQELDRMGSRKRICTNWTCHYQIELLTSAQEWQVKKTAQDLIHYNEPGPHRLLFAPGETFVLKEAQLRSGTGRAVLRLQSHHHAMYFFWHRTGQLPERDDGRRVMAAGSAYWRFVVDLCDQKVWTSEDPLNAMEVLARAATDEPMFAIMEG